MTCKNKEIEGVRQEHFYQSVKEPGTPGRYNPRRRDGGVNNCRGVEYHTHEGQLRESFHRVAAHQIIAAETNDKNPFVFRIK
ncbi:MAG: hypothetical protein Kow0059_10250 [Candidatus Sumerlaeia bacterium]